MSRITEELLSKLRVEEEVRANLISLRAELKRSEKERSVVLNSLREQGNVLVALLDHEDAKARKNAALILGELPCDEAEEALYEAYVKETQLFVRSSYLEALLKLGSEAYVPELTEQLKALDYVETYLSIISKSMRPFSILLVKEINLNDETPDYVDDGLRTLFIAGAETYEDEVAIKESCMAMVNSMVLKKVDQNEALKLQFTDVSGKNNWYFSNWKTHLGCTFSANMQLYFQMGGRLENAFDESKLQAIADDYMTSMYQSFMPAYAGANLAGNIDAVRATRDEFVRMAGDFGFISGETTYGSHNYSPRENQDLEAYVSAIISLGANGFAERYGASPLVMQKYKILADYIVEELGVNLDF